MKKAINVRKGIETMQPRLNNNNDNGNNNNNNNSRHESHFTVTLLLKPMRAPHLVQQMSNVTYTKPRRF